MLNVLPLGGSLFNLFFFFEDFRFFFLGLDLSSTTTLSVIFSIAKLSLIWFLVVWLRMNLMRLRFDQVASYTWHELVIVSIAILILIIILYYVIILDYLFIFSEVFLNLKFLDIFFIFFIFLFALKLYSLKTDYFLFLFFIFFILVLLSLLYLGFTLSFLVLSILYSTVFIVFWIFWVSTNDGFQKKEATSLGFNPMPFILAVSLLSLKRQFSGATNLTPIHLSFMSYTQLDLNEFGIIFNLLYEDHGIVFFFFFIAIIVVCFSVVSLLSTKKKMGLNLKNYGFSLFPGGNSLKNSVQKRVKLFGNSWEFSNRSIKSFL